VREQDEIDGEREQLLQALADLLRDGGMLRGDVVREVAERNCRPLPRSWSVSPARSTR
jgi:hypothetical protein